VASVVAGTNDCINSAYSVEAPALDDNKMHLLIDPRDPSKMPSGVKGTDAPIETALFGLAKNLTTRKAAITRLLHAMDRALQKMKSMSSMDIAIALRKHADFQPTAADALARQLDVSRIFQPTDRFGQFTEAEWSKELIWAKYSLPFIDSSDPLWSFKNRVDMSYANAAAAGLT
jgi:hypothetical protein